MSSSTADDPLAPRLFGYATLFRAHLTEQGIEPVASAGAAEARALAGAMAHHLGVPLATGAADSDVAAARPAKQEWGVSVPFGRCGIQDRPHEHVRIYGAAEAWCDRLGADGSVSSEKVAEGQTLTFRPGSVQRLRARPLADGRVLVAFQTEDRTPLLGHAAAWAGVGASVPDDAARRVLLTHQAFDELARGGEAQIREKLTAFMEQMSHRLAGNAEVMERHQEAEAAGSYVAGADGTLFDRQRSLVTPQILAQIAAGEAGGRFRFPGMFGAVAPLFDLVGL